MAPKGGKEPPPPPRLSLPSKTNLPSMQLESLKFKLKQTMEAIQFLQATVQMEGQPFMHSWPEIMAKYNLVLGQIHNLFRSLSAEGASRLNELPNLVIHPPEPISEGQADLEFSALLRMMRLPTVVAADEKTAKQVDSTPPGQKQNHEKILQEMATIKADHDARVERGLMAVRMLRDKYNWKVRVQPGDDDEEDVAEEEEGTVQQTVNAAEKDGDDESSMSSSGSELFAESVPSTPQPTALVPANGQAEQQLEVIDLDEDDNEDGEGDDDDNMEDAVLGPGSTDEPIEILDDDEAEMALVEESSHL